ncbi:PLP-dependent aminotransferase family protein [Kutzneria buriramensis]|uniref:DNA-binding transcriptional MocR family regulator n=1 Tax=Kutzneria buriramensis TaxID=1045776 RepID=A0A3E0HLV2_9PSEU|nr:PLP-dependent aminotransferase family protein [Kutzneria buriramensis]REH47196.1 DNA-binding transcriptional MocR family regulator [Kutzneria buriramensis]
MTEPIPWPADRLVAQLGRWSASRGPLYLLLAERLRQLIDSGQLPQRAMLPPDRVLAQRLAVGRNTVVAAYERLRQDGKVDRHQGRGTWVKPAVIGVRPSAVPGTNPLFVNYLEPMGDVLSLACAAPQDPPPTLAAALTRAIGRLPTNDIGYYPLGLPELRVAIADRYCRQGLPTTSEQILVTTGGQQALALITRLFLAPGDPVLAQTPTYPGALELFREATAPITGVLIDELAAAIVAHRPRLAYVNPTNHNPTGATLSGLSRRRLVEAAASADTVLIDDEVLADLSFDGVRPPGLASYGLGQVLTVGSVTKLLWGGLRVGWIRGSAGDIAQLGRLKAIHDLGGAALEQLAVADLLPGLEPIIADRVVDLRVRHNHLRAELGKLLPDWTFEPASGGQCLWVALPSGDASAFAQVALRHAVAILPGSALGGSDSHVRIPFTATVSLLTEGVRRIAAAWRDYRPTTGPSPALHALVV